MMDDRYKILHLEDVQSDALLIERELRASIVDFEYLVIETEAAFLKALLDFCPDVILCDHTLPAFNSFGALKILKAKNSSIPFILLTATMTEDVAMSVVRDGADDYIMKDRLKRLPNAVINLIEKYRYEKGLKKLIDEVHEKDMLSKRMLGELSNKLLLATKVAKIGIWEYLFSGNRFIADDLLLEHFGLRSDRFGGDYLALIECIHPGDRAGIVDEFQESIIKHLEWDTEFRVILQDGTIRHIRSSVVAQRDQAGNSTRLIGTSQDVTDDKESRQEMSDSFSAFRQTSDGLTKIMNSSLDLICTIDEQGRFAEVSAASDRMLGYKPADLIGSRFMEFVHPEDRDASEKVSMTVMAGHETNNFENRYVRKDGSIIPLIWSFGWNSVSRLMYCIGRDATEKKQIDQAIEKERQRYSDLFVQIPAFICILKGPDHVFQMANPAYEKLVWRADFIGLPLREVLPEIPAQGYLEILDEVYRTGKPFIGSEIAVKIDTRASGGSIEYYLDFSYQAYRDIKNEIEGVFVFGTDVTEQVMSRRKVEESQEQYRQIVETAQEGIWVTDENDCTKFVNNKMCEIIEYDAEELLGEKIYHFMDDASRIDAFEQIERRKQGMSETYDSVIVTKGGRPLWVNMATNPILDREGHYKGALAMMTNITDRKIAEEQKSFEKIDKDALINTTDDLIWSVSSDFKLIAANQAFISRIKSSTGIELQPGDKLLMGDSFPDEYLNFWAGLYSRALGGETFSKEIYTPAEVYTPDKESFPELWGEIKFNPIYNAGVITGIACYSRDITAAKNYEIALLAINKKLETAQQIAQLGYWEFDISSQVLFWSKEVYNIWELVQDISDVSFQDFHDTIHADDKGLFDERLKSVMDGEGKLDIEHRIVLSDGSVKYVHEKGELVYNEKGEPGRLEGTVQDITGRKMTEDKIRESELRYRSLIEQATDAICIADKAFKFIDSNSCACQMFGYSKAEFLELSLHDILVGEDIEMNHLKVDEVKSGRTVTNERRLKRKNGSIVVMEVSTKLMYDGKYMMFGHDITQRKKGEEAIKQLANRLQMATDSARMGIWDWDLEKAHLSWDEGMYKLYNINDLQFGSVYNGWLSRLHPEDRERVNSDIEMAITGKKEYDTEFRIIWDDLSVHYIKATGKVENDQDGKVIRLIGLNWEVTDLKLVEIRLKELNEDIHRHVKELAVSNAELEQFAYVASHDLQEPLRMITSYLTQLDTKYGEVIDDKGKKYIFFAVDAARRMRQIILDLLEFSRVGRSVDKREEVDLNEIVNEIRILFRSQIEEKNAVILSDKLPSLNSFKASLRQVFQNLIGNALKYTHKDVAVHVQITVRERKHFWEFAVIDDGIGIDKEYFERIFVIFQRLHNKDEFSGTGMGLAVTKKIVENLGGKIWLESEEGKGSAFYFTIAKETSNILS